MLVNKIMILDILLKGGYIKHNNFNSRGMVFDGNNKYVGNLVYKTYVSVRKNYCFYDGDVYKLKEEYKGKKNYRGKLK